MKIEHSGIHLWTIIEDLDRALWLDGAEMYYDTPKDYRPDINPDDLEDALQAYYQLTNLADRHTSKEVNDTLDNLQKLAKIYIDYANHTFGLIIKEQYTAPTKAKGAV